MKPIKTLFFVSGVLVAGLVAIYLTRTPSTTGQPSGKVPTTSYGAFLAAQHALYTNNFDRAGEFMDSINPEAHSYKSVDEIRVLTDFLNGNLPDSVPNSGKNKTIISKIVGDAVLVNKGKWADLYARHKTDNMRLLSPFRIWSGVATNRITDTLKFVNSLGTNPSWEAFLRGQIYAEQGKLQKAIDAFADVRPEFMNINDYLYLMSFYKHNNLEIQANMLRTQFTLKPGSMFMVNYTDVPDWSVYSGYKNQLAFNLVQTVAHTQSMKSSDLSLLLLHFAKNTSDKNQIQQDAINYHSGLYMMSTKGNFDKYFSQIENTSPYYPFVNLRLAELNKDEAAIRKAIVAQPLFIPAVNKLVNWQTQRGDKTGALKAIDNALKNPEISTAAKAHLYKMRAEKNFIFGNLDAAQKDLDSAGILISSPDPDVFSIQARIWAAQEDNLGQAYAYSLKLVNFAPADICTWDVLGSVIRVREGLDESLEIMKMVGELADSCSSLFEHLGDMYMEKGENKLARDAYSRAIELSDDGLTIKPVLEKKLKRIK